METTLSPLLLEFLSEETPITIICSFNLNQIRLFSGTFGPFRAGIPIQVPLWLAIQLRKKDKCRIQPPEWMSIDRLQRILFEERKLGNQEELQPLPYGYKEISSILLHLAPQDFENQASIIRTLIEDIENVRSVKIRKGMPSIFNVRSVIVTNIGAMELHKIKPFLLHGQDTHYRFSQTEATVRKESAAALYMMQQQQYQTTTTTTSSLSSNNYNTVSRAGVSLRKLGVGNTTTSTSNNNVGGLKKVSS
jgi:GINS complex subunit 2